MMSQNQRIYLDHAAATPVSSAVAAVMQKYLVTDFGNPGAVHREGGIAKNAVEDARKRVARILDAQSDEVVFAPSATLAANVAILGSIRAWKKSHPGEVPRIIVSSIEHAAVLEPAMSFPSSEVEVLRLPVLSNGVVDMSALEEMITPMTALVAVMYANNEIGTIQPIKEIARLLRQKRMEYGAKTKEEVAYPLFLSDACQAVLALDLSVLRLGVDLLVLNAAKCYGPKGVGVLYRRRGVDISPIAFGGGQEGGLFPGTENVAAIIGGALAIEHAREGYEEKGKNIENIRDHLLSLLQKEFPDAYLNGGEAARLPNNVSLSFLGVDHENLVIMLDEEGVACSTKSACNETDAEVSHVILALREAGGGVGFPPSAVRMTLGETNTKEEMDQVVERFRKLRDRMRPLV